MHEIFQNTLKIALEQDGWNVSIVTQTTTPHDKNINDEIISELKSAKFVIADFTSHRNSVYFEAGFAMGMRIPIIWTCKKEDLKNSSFDTRQYPFIEWDNATELKEKVIHRINAIK